MLHGLYIVISCVIFIIITFVITGFIFELAVWLLERVFHDE